MFTYNLKGDSLMPVRKANAEWKGTLKEGSGNMKVGSGAFEVPFSFSTRFEEKPGTNPEELIGAAHAGCYSMFLSGLLSGEGLNPTSIRTTATVHLGTVDGAPTVTNIDLVCEAEVPGVSEADFQKQAESAKANCPISKVLAGAEISLKATLVG
jgi:osmotically inducible protein OsmC